MGFMGPHYLRIVLSILAHSTASREELDVIIDQASGVRALSLVYVPAVFTVMDDLESWLRRTLGRFIATPQAQSVQ